MKKEIVKKAVCIILVVVFGCVSVFAIAPWAKDPANYEKTIETLDSLENKAIILKQNTRINLNDTVYENDEIDVLCDRLVQQGNVCHDHLKIVYEDNDCIVIDKDYNRACVPSHTHQYNTVYNCLLGYFKDSENSIHFISRLDKDTSGLVLIAKNPLAACLFNKWI